MDARRLLAFVLTVFAPSLAEAEPSASPFVAAAPSPVRRAVIVGLDPIPVVSSGPALNFEYGAPCSETSCVLALHGRLRFVAPQIFAAWVESDRPFALGGGAGLGGRVYPSALAVATGEDGSRRVVARGPYAGVMLEYMRLRWGEGEDYTWAHVLAPQLELGYRFASERRSITFAIGAQGGRSIQLASRTHWFDGSDSGVWSEGLASGPFFLSVVLELGWSFAR